MPFHRLLLVALSMLGGFSPSARADEAETQAPVPEAISEMPAGGWTAQITLRSQVKKTAGIKGLVLIDREVKLRLLPGKDKLNSRVEVRGRFDRPGWVLFAQKKILAGPSDRGTEFTAPIQLKAGASEVTLTAVGPDKEVEQDTIVLLAPSVQEFRISRPLGDLTASFGGAHISYYQTLLSTLHTTNASLGLDYLTPRWRSPWGLLARGRITLISVTTNQTGQEPQMLEGRVNATYRFTRPPGSRWEIIGLGGFVYLHTLTYGSSFGFAHLGTPELGVRTFFNRSPDSQWRGELRYSPLGGIFKEWNVNTSIAWITRTSSGRRVSIDLGLTNLAFRPIEGALVQLNWVSLLLGYSL